MCLPLLSVTATVLVLPPTMPLNTRPTSDTVSSPTIPKPSARWPPFSILCPQDQLPARVPEGMKFTCRNHDLQADSGRICAETFQVRPVGVAPLANPRRCGLMQPGS